MLLLMNKKHYVTVEFAAPSNQSNQAKTIIDMPKRHEKAQHNFKKGDTVTHEKLGQGIILSVEGERLLVHFDDNTIKNIMADFVVCV